MIDRSTDPGPDRSLLSTQIDNPAWGWQIGQVSLRDTASHEETAARNRGVFTAEINEVGIIVLPETEELCMGAHLIELTRSGG